MDEEKNEKKGLTLPQNLEPGSTAIVTSTRMVDEVALNTMDYEELNEYIIQHARQIAGVLAQASDALDRLLPYIARMHALLSKQGKRTDLHIPEQLTFTQWLEENRDMFGHSRSAIYRRLKKAGMLLLPEGTRVEDIGSGEVGIVERGFVTEDGVSKVAVFINAEQTTLPVKDVRKVPVLNIKLGALVTFADESANEYRYEGERKFTRAGKSQARIREEAREERKQEHKRVRAQIRKAAEVKRKVERAEQKALKPKPNKKVVEITKGNSHE
jgi:hypothetical protein